jgi:ribosomal protein L40E
VSCDACHGSTNFFGVADRRLAQVGMVTAAFVPGSQAIALPVDNATCLSCHETGLRKVSVGNGIRMSHKQVIDAKWACSTCHPDVAHRNRGSTGTRGYSMDMCLKCHGMDPTNVKSCDKCHVKGRSPSLAKQTSWRLTHGPDWRRTHGLGDLTTCKACHTPDKCVSCHGMEVPHSSGFREQHGKLTVSRPTGAEDCYVCHDRSACISCHGLEMPHPENFLPGHKAVVKKSGRDVCYRCHEKSSCDACHARHAHPGLKPEHRRWLEAHPTAGGTR